MSPNQAKNLIREFKLRATPARISVLCLLSNQTSPMSYSDLVDLSYNQESKSNECDPATIYRNLIKFTEVGLTRVVSQAHGKPRYELASHPDVSIHKHPHFFCIECEGISCLPGEILTNLSLSDQWKESITQASIQLQGRCPECV
jgi:Fe2+ or Zn2+ uptake regulation protein